jgi:hypothetical protein
LRATDLCLTSVRQIGRIRDMTRKKSAAKSKPPTPGPRSLRACKSFARKLDEVLARTAITDAQLEEELGLGANCLGRWRKLKLIRLDDAWLVAKRLGASLDLLADDARGIVVDQSIRVAEGPPDVETRAIAHHADDPTQSDPPKSDSPKRRVHRQNPARRRTKR